MRLIKRWIDSTLFQRALVFKLNFVSTDVLLSLSNELVLLSLSKEPVEGACPPELAEGRQGFGKIKILLIYLFTAPMVLVIKI
jgi:hypothetical protein